MPTYDGTPDAPAEQSPYETLNYTFDFSNQLGGIRISSAAVVVIDNATGLPLVGQDTYVPAANVQIIVGTAGPASAVEIAVARPPAGADWRIAVLASAGTATYEIDLDLVGPVGTILGWATPRDVRLAVDPTLTAAELPDSVIRLPLFQGRAEAWVRALDPLLATRPVAVQQGAALAAALYCAGLLVASWPVMRSERFGDYMYQRDIPATAAASGVSPEVTRQRQLFAEALAQLTLALGAAVTTALPLPERATMFARSGGGRMQRRGPFPGYADVMPEPDDPMGVPPGGPI